jgi:hypothetical protein
MPGYYLCLIQQVSVSVVALISPTYGIRATLTSAGLTRCGRRRYVPDSNRSQLARANGADLRNHYVGWHRAET